MTDTSELIEIMCWNCDEITVHKDLVCENCGEKFHPTEEVKFFPDVVAWIGVLLICSITLYVILVLAGVV